MRLMDIAELKQLDGQESSRTGTLDNGALSGLSPCLEGQAVANSGSKWQRLWCRGRQGSGVAKWFLVEIAEHFSSSSSYEKKMRRVCK